MPNVSSDQRAQQSAEREDQMRNRFGLSSGGAGRSGVDALLRLENGVEVPFELKSTDSRSVSTARDVGRDHIRKWRQRHWLFGFYVRGSRNPPVAIRYIYASPRQLEPWILEQEQYVLPDWEIVRNLPPMSSINVLGAVIGYKGLYTLADARRLLKQQKLEVGEHMTEEMRGLLDQAGIPEPGKMTARVYQALMDRRAGFSPSALRMLISELRSPPPESAITEALGDRPLLDVEDAAKLLRSKRFSNGSCISRQLLAVRADHRSGYTPERMMVLLRERARYLLDRGATRNNPHISDSTVNRLVPPGQVILPDDGRLAQRLEVLVTDELAHGANQGDPSVS